MSFFSEDQEDEIEEAMTLDMMPNNGYVSASTVADELLEDEAESPDTLDLSGQELEKLTRAVPEHQLNTTTLILDGNRLQRLDNIHTYQCIEKVGHYSHKLYIKGTLLYQSAESYITISLCVVSNVAERTY